MQGIIVHINWSIIHSDISASSVQTTTVTYENVDSTLVSTYSPRPNLFMSDSRHVLFVIGAISLPKFSVWSGDINQKILKSIVS